MENPTQTLGEHTNSTEKAPSHYELTAFFSQDVLSSNYLKNGYYTEKEQKSHFES